MTEEPLVSFLSTSNEQCQPEKRRFKVDRESRLCWSSCLRHLERELTEKTFGYADVVHSLLKLLLFDIVRIFKLRFKVKSAQPLVAKALQFIEENYRETISLSDVAAAVDRSPAYLTDLVRKTTGKTVLGWIVEHRMAHARQMLLYTSHSVAHIAEQVGYFDRRHFSRQFLRSHNLTPQKWRHVHSVNNAVNTVTA
ncbi:helix-turn-helix transcriptional regulator [cf. Phormidesmis sp. LEGE 11477]|nr:helix-turn-helix transcriptional regulator [cf. Phormidesmis sp. LEGE 11477]